MMPGNPVVGGVVLRRAAIASPNFVTTVSGWTINADGSAEFNSVTLRGVFIVGVSPNPQVILQSTGGTGFILLPTNAGVELAPAKVSANSQGAGGAQTLVTAFVSAETTVAPDRVYVLLQSNNAAGSNSAIGELGYTDTLGVQRNILQWDSNGLHVLQTLFGASGTLTIGDAVHATGAMTVDGALTVAGSPNTGTSGLTDGTINGSAATAGLTNGTITGTSGGASAGTAHTHGPGSFAVSNGQHVHAAGSYAVTNGTHNHVL